jgi:hypothetical protein
VLKLLNLMFENSNSKVCDWVFEFKLIFLRSMDVIFKRIDFVI